MRALALAALLAGCATTSRDKGLQPSLTTRDALGAPLEPRRYAVLVGVDDYVDPAFPRLHHAGADAEALGEALRRAEGGGFDRVVVLTGTEGDREHVLRALRELREDLRREDAVVVYFSGHGTRVLDDDAWRRFLLLSDSRAGNLEATAFDLAELQAYFAGLPAERKALIVDACFNGDGKSVVRPDTLGREVSAPLEPLVPKLYAMGSGEAQLFATSAGRPSREDDKLGHGVYTYYLLEALGWGFQEADLDRDEVVTVWEAHDYARGRTMEHTAGVQVPDAAFRVVGEADLVLAGDEARRRAREQALVYLYSNHGPYADARVLVDGRDRGVLPGAIPVEPGRHHVEIRRDGEVLVEGYGHFAADEEYRVDELHRVVQGPDRMLGLRPAYVRSAALAPVIGDGALGAELWWVRRADRGPARGLFGEAVLGGAGAPGREIEGVRVGEGRPVLWTALSTGYQGDWRRLRYRTGLGVTGVLVPPDYLQPYGGHPEPAAVPAEAGWWLLAGGPTLEAGYVVRGGWTLTATARLHAAALDLEGDGGAALVPWTTTGLGIELAY